MEVQNRPALYDTTLRQYSDRNMRNRHWKEVYDHVDNWMELLEVKRRKKETYVYIIFLTICNI